MPEPSEQVNWNPRNINIATATEDDLRRLKALSDDDILRAASSLDLFSVAESNRRLKEALHGEEKAIKNLTVALVVLTCLLVVLTGILVWLGIGVSLQ